MSLSGREHIAFICVMAFLSGFSSQAAEPPTRVYQCEKDGVLTFSDRPCGARAQPYEPDFSRTSTYTPPKAGASIATDRASKKRRSSRADEMRRLAKHEARCAKLADSLGKVRAKMRSGYRAGEGEKLKAREARLKEQWRQARCR